MEKYIEEIIEIVLDNVSCDHPVNADHSMGVNFDDPTYSLDNEQEVIKKVMIAITKRLIEKQGLKGSQIEEKAKEFLGLINQAQNASLVNEAMSLHYLGLCIELVGSLANELEAKIKLKGD